MTAPPSGARLWIAGARVRTLPAAVVPVAVGTSAAASGDLGAGQGISWIRFVLAMVVSLALQVGVNYANDYSDGVRGTDDDRAGPLRLVGSGLVGPGAVKRAAGVAFLVAAAAGLVLAALAGWWLIAVGAASIVAGWFYTGGPKPYGYLGLGEIFVFVFFGVVATAGSAFVQRESLTGLDLMVSVPVGLLATALLVTNNLRDIPSDRAAEKNTLAVRMGDAATRQLYTAMIVGVFATIVAIAVLWRTPALLALIAMPLAITPIRTVASGVAGPGLIAVLEGSGKLQLAAGSLLAAGLWIGA